MKKLSVFIKEQLVQERMYAWQSKPIKNPWTSDLRIMRLFQQILSDGYKSYKKGYMAENNPTGKGEPFKNEFYVFSKKQTDNGDVKLTDCVQYKLKNFPSDEEIKDMIKKNKFFVLSPRDKKLAQYLVDKYGFEDVSHNIEINNACGISFKKLAAKTGKIAGDMVYNDEKIAEYAK